MTSTLLFLAVAHQSPLIPMRSAHHETGLLSLRGGEQTGKIWSLNTFSRDHARLALELPSYLGSYIGPNRLDAKTIEEVMLTVNSVNTCPFCTGLHGELARMANAAVKSETPATKYAYTFAEESGRGPKVDDAFTTLTAAIGSSKARYVRALCWALNWGKTTGNTIKLTTEKLKRLQLTQLSSTEVVVYLLYAPLFLVIAVLNAGLRFAPAVPGWVSAIIGASLWLPQAAHILPIGLASLVIRLLVSAFVKLTLL